MEFGAAMKLIRSWLGGRKIRVAEFTSEPKAGGGYIFTIGFRCLDDATLFKAQFGK